MTIYAHEYKGHELRGLDLIDAPLFPFFPESWNTYTCRDYNMDAWNDNYVLWHTDIDQYVNNFVSRMDKYLTPEEISMIKE